MKFCLGCGERIIKGEDKFKKYHIKKWCSLICKHRGEKRKARMKNFEGIEYKNMLEKQNGVCAICHNPERRLKKDGTPRLLSVDHNHETGKIRGILCARCNQTMGTIEYFGLQSIIDYLSQ